MYLKWHIIHNSHEMVEVYWQNVTYLESFQLLLWYEKLPNQIFIFIKFLHNRYFLKVHLPQVVFIKRAIADVVSKLHLLTEGFQVLFAKISHNFFFNSKTATQWNYWRVKNDLFGLCYLSQFIVFVRSLIKLFCCCCFNK